MTRAALWLRIVAGWAAAAALLALAHPARLHSPWSPLAAAPAGLAVGIVLFLVSGGRLRRLVAPGAATASVLALSAAAEEVIWRWFVLGELMSPAGVPAALAASSLLFALAHRDGLTGRLVAGAIFGAVYVSTGSLTGACCAHAAYNLCVAGVSLPAARSEGAPT